MLVTASDLAERMKARIAQINAEASLVIAQGVPADYAEYREKVGLLSALKQMDDEINRLMKQRD